LGGGAGGCGAGGREACCGTALLWTAPSAASCWTLPPAPSLTPLPLPLPAHPPRRGPKAAPTLATALAAALRAALAAGAGAPHAPVAGAAACFHLLLREADRADCPLAAARPALAPHMEGLFCDAAARGARGALQALLVCLPEHDGALGPAALAAARAAGQAGAAADVELLLALRAGAGTPPADAAAAAAAAPAPAREACHALGAPCGGRARGSLGSSADVHVIIEAAHSLGGGSSVGAGSCCASPAGPGGAPGCALGAGGAGGAACARCGGARAGSASSMSSSSADSECGGDSDGRSSLGAASDGGAGAMSSDDDGGCAPDPPPGPPPPRPPPCRVRAGLREAVAADDVVRAARLLTELVDGGPGSAEPGPDGGGVDATAQPLDAFILDLVTIAAAAGTCDCAHLLMTAIGSNDDEELKGRACRALALAAAAAGRAGLLRVAAAHHGFFAAALAGAGGALAREAARAAALRGHPHTAVWLARRARGGGGAAGDAAARADIEALARLPAWQLQQEAASLALAAAAAGAPAPPAAKSAPPPAPPDARALVDAFNAAWAAAEARGRA
jgi:hypothetical protein